MSYLNGLIDLPWWGYVVVTLIFTHITMASVTIFLHRHQAHRALDLHPIVSHFFRFWLWLGSGMVTKEWAAIHRKHHAHCETVNDPHSPVIYGIKKVLLEGSELYRKEAKNQETLTKFGKGTPDDWLERNLYSKHSALGIYLLIVINVVLFGPIGLTMWAVKMVWTPIFAAGIINGLGHWWGYRNYDCDDASTNIFPWGILIAGEELHNNHHTFGTSAKLSNKWFEFDIGWMYICILSALGLAKVRKVAPKAVLTEAKLVCDLQTLQAVIANRYDVVTRFSQSLKQVCVDELAKLKEKQHFANLNTRKVSQQIIANAKKIPEAEHATLQVIFEQNPDLHTIHTMRQELAELWERSSKSSEQLVKHLQDWCHRAENSGIAALQEFSLRLRSYA